MIAATDLNTRSAPDQKLLIIHCDDLGMAHSINAAAFRSFQEGAITSASVMTPCPWFPEVAAFARENKDLDLGIHFTLTSEWPAYRWRPIAPRDCVQSLVDPQGYFWSTTEMLAARANPMEVELELEAQIEHAVANGLKPTHLDSHMFALGHNRDLLCVYVKVARKYDLPFLLPPKGSIGADAVSLFQNDDILLETCR